MSAGVQLPFLHHRESIVLHFTYTGSVLCISHFETRQQQQQAATVNPNLSRFTHRQNYSHDSLCFFERTTSTFSQTFQIKPHVTPDTKTKHSPGSFRRCNKARHVHNPYPPVPNLQIHPLRPPATVSLDTSPPRLSRRPHSLHHNLPAPGTLRNLPLPDGTLRELATGHATADACAAATATARNAAKQFRELEQQPTTTLRVAREDHVETVHETGEKVLRRWSRLQSAIVRERRGIVAVGRGESGSNVGLKTFMNEQVLSVRDRMTWPLTGDTS